MTKLPFGVEVSRTLDERGTTYRARVLLQAQRRVEQFCGSDPDVRGIVENIIEEELIGGLEKEARKLLSPLVVNGLPCECDHCKEAGQK